MAVIIRGTDDRWLSIKMTSSALFVQITLFSRGKSTNKVFLLTTEMVTIENKIIMSVLFMHNCVFMCLSPASAMNS